MNGVLMQVLELVLMIAVGIGVAKLGVITQEGRKVLTNLVLYVTQPFLVINSFQVDYNPKLLGGMGVIAVFAALSLAAFYGLGILLWPRGDDGKRRVFRHAMLFSNCGFMGYPVLLTLFGKNGVVYGSIYVLVFTVYLWTLGVYIYAGKSGTWKQVLLQPGLIAVAVGIPMFIFNFRWPSWLSWLGDTVSGIGSLTTPLAMITVGALVAEGDFRELFKDWTISIPVTARLILLPAIALGAFWLLGGIWPGARLASPAVQAGILLTAMPVAANAAIFASMFAVKPQYAAHTVLVSTLLSVATIPAWIFALNLLIGK